MRAEGRGQRAEEGSRAALLTPPGTGAIAVVRISGPLVERFLSDHFSKSCKLNRCVHGELRDGDRIIDDPVIVLSGKEQIADINLHGGQWVVRECLELARRAGFEILETTDDLIDARSTLEREMLAALPFARTEFALRALLDQPRLWAQFRGESSQKPKPALQGRVREILNDQSLWHLLNPPRIAIVGAPNVGKSTLSNQLFGQQRSITADLPGTTRDWVADYANIDGLPIHLLDTPGLRDSSDTIEQAAIAASQREIEQADLKILVLDPTQSLEGVQREVLNRHSGAMIIINKSDLSCAMKLNFENSIHLSALNGTGLDILRQTIKEHFGIGSNKTSPRWWTERQRKLLALAMDDPQILNEL